MDFYQASENDYDFSALKLGNILINLSMGMVIVFLIFGFSHPLVKKEANKSISQTIIVIDENGSPLAPAQVPNVDFDSSEDLMPPMLAEDSWPAYTDSISC